MHTMTILSAAAPVLAAIAHRLPLAALRLYLKSHRDPLEGP